MYLTNKNDKKKILTIVDTETTPKLNKVKQRCLILSPTVNAGLEHEGKISDFEKEKEIEKLKTEIEKLKNEIKNGKNDTEKNNQKIKEIQDEFEKKNKSLIQKLNQKNKKNK